MNFLPILLQMAQEAGQIALKYFDNSSPTLKGDQSVLTKADLAVSSYISETLKNLLKTQEHLLIQEEDLHHQKHFSQSYLESAPYIWVVDPIDGTRNYANQIPLFGISIGILKDLKPWMGVVFLPLLKELFYCDGEFSFYIKNAFSPQQKQKKICPLEVNISPHSIFFTTETLIKNAGWNESLCHLFMSECAVVDLCWPAIGRGCGSFFNSHIWDFAGAWPVYQAAGLKLRSLVTSHSIEKIHVDLFHASLECPWQLKEQYLLSTEKNYSFLKEKLICPRSS